MVFQNNQGAGLDITGGKAILIQKSVPQACGDEPLESRGRYLSPPYIRFSGYYENLNGRLNLC